MEKFPRILIISHNVLGNATNMGKILSSFFYQWPLENLAQLYFRPEVPIEYNCVNYFRITDVDIVKTLISSQQHYDEYCIKKQGFPPDETSQNGVSHIYKIGHRQGAGMCFLREKIWRKNTWKSKDLKKWVKSFSPDMIFFASSDYCFPYDLVQWISDYMDIPVLTYICDDFYFSSQTNKSLLYHLLKKRYKNRIGDFYEKNKNAVCICNELTKAYKNEFGICGYTIMPSAQRHSFIKKKKFGKSGFQISYLGNVSLGRNKALVEIGKALKDLNKNLTIDIYTTENDTRLTKDFKEENGISFKGSVGAEEVRSILVESDLILHVESMERNNKERVKYSISTKIAESLLSGTCMFGYGPGDVASIDYLKRNEVAQIATKISDLKEKLREIIENESLRSMYIINAKKLAERNHNIEKNMMQFKNIALKLLSK